MGNNDSWSDFRHRIASAVLKAKMSHSGSRRHSDDVNTKNHWLQHAEKVGSRWATVVMKEWQKKALINHKDKNRPMQCSPGYYWMNFHLWNFRWQDKNLDESCCHNKAPSLTIPWRFCRRLVADHFHHFTTRVDLRLVATAQRIVHKAEITSLSPDLYLK